MTPAQKKWRKLRVAGPRKKKLKEVLGRGPFPGEIQGLLKLEPDLQKFPTGHLESKRKETKSCPAKHENPAKPVRIAELRAIYQTRPLLVTPQAAAKFLQPRAARPSR